MSTEYTVLSTRHGTSRVRGAECIAIRQVHAPHSVLSTPYSVLRTLCAVPSTALYRLPAAHCKPMRRAFGLIEMLVAISVGAVLMGIAVSLLIVLLGAEQSGRVHAERSESLRRLADQFRRDVHAAVDVADLGEAGEARGTVPFSLTRESGQSLTRKSGQSPEDRHECRLALADGGSVRYTISADGISRVEQVGSKDVRRESYALPEGSTAAIVVDRTTSPWTLSLTIVPNDASLGSGHEIRIDAVLGRDHRFAEQRKEGK
jgi:prepilin-type N-terminal cleavage/methylation domain-containing protein